MSTGGGYLQTLFMCETAQYVCVYLQSGQYYLLYRVEVSLPQELGLLSQGKDLVLVDGSYC